MRITLLAFALAIGTSLNAQSEKGLFVSFEMIEDAPHMVLEVNGMSKFRKGGVVTLWYDSEDKIAMVWEVSVNLKKNALYVELDQTDLEKIGTNGLFKIELNDWYVEYDQQEQKEIAENLKNAVYERG